MSKIKSRQWRLYEYYLNVVLFTDVGFLDCRYLFASFPMCLVFSHQRLILIQKIGGTFTPSVRDGNGLLTDKRALFLFMLIKVLLPKTILSLN